MCKTVIKSWAKNFEGVFIQESSASHITLSTPVRPSIKVQRRNEVINNLMLHFKTVAVENRVLCTEKTIACLLQQFLALFKQTSKTLKPKTLHSTAILWRINNSL